MDREKKIDAIMGVEVAAIVLSALVSGAYLYTNGGLDGVHGSTDIYESLAGGAGAGLAAFIASVAANVLIVNPHIRAQDQRAAGVR